MSNGIEIQTFLVAKLLYNSLCPSVRNAIGENVIFSAPIQERQLNLQ